METLAGQIKNIQNYQGFRENENKESNEVTNTKRIAIIEIIIIIKKSMRKVALVFRQEEFFNKNEILMEEPSSPLAT